MSETANIARRRRNCETKNFYPDKKAAVSAINKLMKNRGRHGVAMELRAYPCPFGNHWHLTKAKHE